MHTHDSMEDQFTGPVMAKKQSINHVNYFTDKSSIEFSERLIQQSSKFVGAEEDSKLKLNH